MELLTTPEVWISFFTLALLTWYGSGPLSLDRLLTGPREAETVAPE